MANRTQDKLYETFAAVSGKDLPDGQASSLDPFIDAGEELASSVSDIAQVMSSTVGKGTVAAGPGPAGQPAPDAVSDLIAMVLPPGNSPAAAPTALSSDTLPAVNSAGANVAPSTSTTTTSSSLTSTLVESVFGSVPLMNAVAGAASGSSASSGGGSELESIASTVLKSGLGIIPLIGGLIGLFGGGDSTTPALEKYEMPGSIGFEGADTGSGIGASDFDQMGAPRTYGSNSGGSSSGSSSGSTSSGSAPAPQITVSVQAMDARSFMDRSSDIAAAVRDAMLNLNSINDVVSEL